MATTEAAASAIAEASDHDVIGWFEDMAENAGLVQSQTLRLIVEGNVGSEYLQKWLGGAPCVRDLSLAELEALFTSAVPLASHDDFEPYIQRIADGDSSPILTQEPITLLSLSSGTTDGRPKCLPFTRFSALSTLQIFRLAAAYRSRVFPMRPHGRNLEFIYSSKPFRTKGGLMAGTATTHYFASEEFKVKQVATKCFTCSPCQVIMGGDYKESTYCHLLLGLLFHDQVEIISSTFVNSIVQAFTTLEDIWEELCENIRLGRLSSKVISPEMRQAVGEHLAVPNPLVASSIAAKCKDLEGSDWCTLIPSLWPNAKYVYSIMTGSMQPYLKKLRHYAGDVALVSAEYGSTESWIGVNLEPLNPPEKVVFTVIPAFSYFEFIPLHKKQNQDGSGSVTPCDNLIEGQPVPLSQITLGQQYEIVLTTFTGLYRYRLGDVVEVAGFYKGTPQLAFVCRRKLILTINIDKNTERDLQLVVDNGYSLLLGRAKGAELVDFTSRTVPVDGRRPGHYVIYWEIKGEVEAAVLQECCCAMDAAFVDRGYVVSRKTSSIGPLELRIVESGTFRKIMEHLIGNGGAVSQFKTPRCIITNQDLVAILDCCTVKHFWSTAYASN